MKNITIRPMTSEDINEVLRLVRQLDESFLSGHGISHEEIKKTIGTMRGNKYIYYNYVAEAENGICGLISAVVYVTFFHSGGTCLINELIVDKEFRGYGIGKQLIDTVIKMSQQLKLNEVEVSTTCENAKAISFYRKNGLRDESILLGMELGK